MLATVVGLFALGAVLEWLHPLGQAGAYHAFANTRGWLGVPNAADVLSNLPIFLAGVAIVLRLRMPGGPAGSLRHGLLVAGVGLMLTGLGSAYYHYAPSDATLIWDRLPLAVVFAGVLLCAWSCAGVAGPSRFDTVLFVLASLGSVAYWVYLGSLWPYALLQFGGMAVLLWLAASRRLSGARAWWLLILLYALAKVFELLDEPVWTLSRHAVSGHTLKHLMSAAAGLCLLWVGMRSPSGAAVAARPSRA